MSDDAYGCKDICEFAGNVASIAIVQKLIYVLGRREVSVWVIISLIFGLISIGEVIGRRIGKATKKRRAQNAH